MSVPLFHGTEKPDPFNEIRATTYAQEKNSITAHWVFATHRRDLAYVYALPRMTAFMTTLSKYDPEETAPLALFRFHTTESFAAEPVQGQIYIIPSDGFKRVAERPREWVREQPVKLTPHNHKVIKVNSARDVMKEGVQIFTLKRETDFALIDDMYCGFIFKHGCYFETVAEVLNQSNSPLVWENQKAGIGMNPTLKHMIKSGPSFS